MKNINHTKKMNINAFTNENPARCSPDKTGIRPEVMETIRNLAEKHHIETVILFGSRARGDFKRTSDIDLAIYGGNIAGFCLDVEEETPTLLKYDFIDLGQCVTSELSEEIYRDGKLLYRHMTSDLSE